MRSKSALENCRKICGILSEIWLRSAVSVDDMVSLMPMRKSCDVETTTGVNQVDMIDTLSARPKNKNAQNLRVNFEVSKYKVDGSPLPCNGKRRERMKME